MAPALGPCAQADAVLRLKVKGDTAATATGAFTLPTEFMKLRAQRDPGIDHAHYLSAGPFEDADRTATDLTEYDFVTGRFTDLPFVLGLRVPQCRQAVADRREGARPVWFYGLTDTSWACVMFRDGQRSAPVRQSGPRRLWDEVTDAYRWVEGKRRTRSGPAGAHGRRVRRPARVPRRPGVRVLAGP
ncbi:hypothetical protein ACFRI7_05845 [Streptomyces sp. NPDC056716]|uniref:hypothetical protein n=1 Tax=unclassified Streptomyces TaxID=2593676 RepID=UPI0036C24682